MSVAEFMLHSYIAKEMNRVIVFIIKLDNLPLNFVTQGCGHSVAICQSKTHRGRNRKSLHLHDDTYSREIRIACTNSMIV